MGVVVRFPDRAAAAGVPTATAPFAAGAFAFIPDEDGSLGVVLRGVLARDVPPLLVAPSGAGGRCFDVTVCEPGGAVELGSFATRDAALRVATGWLTRQLSERGGRRRGHG